MRTIEHSTRFKRDYKREAKGRFRSDIDTILMPVLEDLVADKPLDAQYHDHDLSGNWRDGLWIVRLERWTPACAGVTGLVGGYGRNEIRAAIGVAAL